MNEPPVVHVSVGSGAASSCSNPSSLFSRASWSVRRCCTCACKISCVSIRWCMLVTCIEHQAQHVAPSACQQQALRKLSRAHQYADKGPPARVRCLASRLVARSDADSPCWLLTDAELRSQAHSCGGATRLGRRPLAGLPAASAYRGGPGQRRTVHILWSDRCCKATAGHQQGDDSHRLGTAQSLQMKVHVSMTRLCIPAAVDAIPRNALLSGVFACSCQARY